MALVNCPECGKKISERAIACPACGYPMADNRRESTRREFPFLTPLAELAALAEGFASALRESLRPEPRQPEAGDKEKEEKKPKDT